MKDEKRLNFLARMFSDSKQDSDEKKREAANLCGERFGEVIEQKLDAGVSPEIALREAIDAAAALHVEQMAK